MSDPVSDLKRELLAAAERRHIDAPVAARRRLFGPRVGGAPRVLAIGTALGVAALAVLVFTTPWSGPPDFLERAEAALTPPTGTILHQKWVAVGTYTRLSGGTCTIRSSAEIWLDGETWRYRSLLHNTGFAPYPRPPTLREMDRLFCMERRYEIGGEYGGETLQFLPPSRIVRAPANVRWGERDPVEDLRLALAAGEARDAGTTRRHGRTVRRICVLDVLRSECVANAYVDPTTFHPVEIVGGGTVTRFLVFEYLPRTAANRALTSIRAQHPHASGP